MQTKLKTLAIIITLLAGLLNPTASGEQVPCDVAITACNKALLATEAELEHMKRQRDFYKEQSTQPKMTWEEKAMWGIVGIAIGVIITRGLR
jgi:hypothetical protein